MRGGTLLLLWKSFRIFRLFCPRQDAIIMLKFIAGGGFLWSRKAAELPTTAELLMALPLDFHWPFWPHLQRQPSIPENWGPYFMAGT